jgi:hypothetical protein
MQAINFEQNCAPHWGRAQGNLAKSPKNMRIWLILGQKTGFSEIKPDSAQFQDVTRDRHKSIQRSKIHHLDLV